MVLTVACGTLKKKKKKEGANFEWKKKKNEGRELSMKHLLLEYRRATYINLVYMKAIIFLKFTVHDKSLMASQFLEVFKKYTLITHIIFVKKIIKSNHNEDAGIDQWFRYSALTYVPKFCGRYLSCTNGFLSYMYSPLMRDNCLTSPDQNNKVN